MKKPLLLRKGGNLSCFFVFLTGTIVKGVINKMATINLNNFKTYGKENREKKTKEELIQESNALLKEYDAILKLPDKEFLSEDVTKRLHYIRKRLVEIVKLM